MNQTIKIEAVLKEQFKKKKLTQTTLASRAKINKSTLHGYCYGAIPKGLISLIKIAQVIEVSLDEIIFGSDKEQINV